MEGRTREISALHFATRQPLRLRWESGQITALEPAPDATPKAWLAPPLLDLQINGYGGVDFQRDGLTLEELLAATRNLRWAGCTGYLLTLITDAWPKLMNRLRHLRALRAQSSELQHAIKGWHIEGPFLSPEPGFCGAHDSAVMCDPQPEHVNELRAATGTDPVLITIAPERTGAIKMVELAVDLGLKVSVGHTNASREMLAAAMRAGATGFTHLGNGCPHDLDRHDNILWRVFDQPGFVVSLIPDRIHVSAELFRLAHRVLGNERIYYTSDAMAAAGSPPGRYTIGKLELEVGSDQIVRLPGRTNFAGSALRPIDGVFRAAEMLQQTWQETWRRFSLVPANFMGFGEPLQIGGPATFCLVEADEPGTLRSLRVFVDGCEVS